MDSDGEARGRESEPAREHGTTERKTSDEAEANAADNPPRTTSFGWFTVPKFGSATSGGGELEPGPERD
jgi:hypothetical protein